MPEPSYMKLEAIDKFRKTQFLFEYLSVRNGFIKGHRDYQKFIVLTRARSGSNLIGDLLGSSSQILLSGEIFQNRNRRIIWNHWQPKYYKSQEVLDLRGKDPIQFLEEAVFRPYPRRIKAVGFKLFYSHAVEPEWQPVWDYLKEDRSIKVIHLQRRNILKSHLSKAFASKNKCHIERQRPFQKLRVSADIDPIELSYEACKEDFERTVNWQKEARSFFAQHDVKEVIYEDFVRNWDNTLNDLQAFLGATPEVLRTSMVKQSSKPMSDSISNYWELKEKFQGTPWVEFFPQ